MFSVDNFYDYLTHTYGWPNKNCDNFLYAFNNHGDRNLWNLVALCDDDLVLKRTQDLKIVPYFGRIYLFDQEPIDFSSYYINYESVSEDRKECWLYSTYDEHFAHLSRFRQFSLFLATFKSPIICHSESNSAEIKLLEKHGFIPVHYFYHGLVSRDWFRHWKHYVPEFNSDTKRFGIYARDAAGSRKYRIDVLDSLIDMHDQVYYKIQPKIYEQIQNKPEWKVWDHAVAVHESHASASISWNDCSRFQIQLVAETLFDTNKVHLTEKVFKPIVMNQPFILFSGPKSLEYLKQYGFKTFDSLWNEDYDTITDSQTRLHAIIDLIKTLYELPKDKFDKLMEKTRSITEYNRNHFFSDEFEQILLNELHKNMHDALNLQNDQFLNFTHSVIFDQRDYLYQKTGSIPDIAKHSNINILEYLKNHHPDLADRVYKKYNHLF